MHFGKAAGFSPFPHPPNGKVFQIYGGISAFSGFQMHHQREKRGTTFGSDCVETKNIKLQLSVVERWGPMFDRILNVYNTYFISLRLRDAFFCGSNVAHTQSTRFCQFSAAWKICKYLRKGPEGALLSGLDFGLLTGHRVWAQNAFLIYCYGVLLLNYYLCCLVPQKGNFNKRLAVNCNASVCKYKANLRVNKC